MIKFMKSWCEGIIVAIIISIIIEMIVPEGNNKKYVKVVIGIFIIFVILNPILSKINNNFNFENVFEAQTVEVSTDLDKNIKDVYVKGIEENIKNDLNDMGYTVSKVEVDVDLNYENLENIWVNIEKNNNKNIIIEEINISKDNNEENENFKEIKDILSEKYSIGIEKIEIW